MCRRYYLSGGENVVDPPQELVNLSERKRDSVNLSDKYLVGIEAGGGCVHPETVRAEKAKSEPGSLYLTVGRQVMD